MGHRIFIFPFILVTLTCLSAKPGQHADGHFRYKLIADSIFHANQLADAFSFQQVYEDGGKVAVFTGDLFSVRKKHAVVLYTTNDNTVELDLYGYKAPGWTLFQKMTIRTGNTGPADHLVFFERLTSNRSKSLMLLTNVWELREMSNFKAFILSQNKLTEIKGFEEFPDPVYDTASGNIYSYGSAGCADLSMVFMEGRILQNRLITRERINCDCCSGSGQMDSCLISKSNMKSFQVAWDSAHKYVQHWFRDFLREKLKAVKEQ